VLHKKDAKMKRLTLRLTDEQHKIATDKAKQSGQSLNDYLSNLASRPDNTQLIIDVILSNQNRAFDSLFVQISEQKSQQIEPNNQPIEVLTSTQFFEFQRQFLGLFSILSGGLKLENLQQKVNFLQDKITQK
jgi:uncharacterized protein (DUF1778 family)